jgi:hypothetical protein
MREYDAIIILGGGVTPSGEPTPWVVPRLDLSLEFTGSPYLLVLGAGTPHKPPPLDAAGFPINECSAMARYLIERGCSPDRIVMESCSSDTIGNAYFARVIHADPRGWRNLAVVTSKFHMKRSKAIFESVFALPHDGQTTSLFSLNFFEVPDVGIDQESLKDREERERKSVTSWLWKAREFESLQSFSKWLFTQHECYSAGRKPQRALGAIAQSY